MGDNDAESDTESYFLTPVNEYNIVDKIQSANNQLFSSIDEINTMEFDKQQMENITSKSDRQLLQSKHRVTFSSDIEEYEDDVSEEECACIEYKDDEAIDQEIAEIIARDEQSTTVSTENDKLDGLIKRMSMSIEEIYSNADGSGSDENDYTTELEVVEDSIVNTVNESVVIEDIDQKQSIVPTSPNTNPYTDETDVQNDKEIEIEKEKKKIIQLNLNKPTNGLKVNDPPCRACTKVTTSSIGRIPRRPTTTQTRTAFKKSNEPTMNRIASAHAHANSSNMPIIDQDDLLKIHLNVRACCENKYLDNNRLPRYNGYISQYGLSKDQLELRESNRKKYIEKRARREREIIKAKQEIADLNEQAFRQWLIRKNHVARPKYKNMYDEEVPKPRIKYHPSKKFSKPNETRNT